MQFSHTCYTLLITLASTAIIGTSGKLESLRPIYMDMGGYTPSSLAKAVMKQAQTETTSKHGNIEVNGVAIKKEDVTKNADKEKNDSDLKWLGSMKLASISENKKTSTGTGTNAQSSNLSSNQSTSTCQSMDQRKPWSKASREERKGFLDAIQCTFYRAGSFQHEQYSSMNLLETYAMLHTYLSPSIHMGAPFLPCHRQFLNVWIRSLRTECNYKGVILYADWNTYADKGELWTSSDLWAPENFNTLECPVTREGSLGRNRYRFRGARQMSNTSLELADHHVCRILRKVDSEGEVFEEHFKSEVISDILEKNDSFEDFSTTLEIYYHNPMHKASGGDMLRNTSPYDALIFFMHHLSVDCIWWSWQKKDNGRNIKRYGGTHRGTNQTATIKDACPMMGVGGPNLPVMDMLNPDEAPNCFSCPYMLQ